jgi:hypothetical protein
VGARPVCHGAEEHTLNRGLSLALPMPGTRATLRNTGNVPVVVFRVTITPQGPGSPTTGG